MIILKKSGVGQVCQQDIWRFRGVKNCDTLLLGFVLNLAVERRMTRNKILVAVGCLSLLSSFTLMGMEAQNEDPAMHEAHDKRLNDIVRRAIVEAECNLSNAVLLAQYENFFKKLPDVMGKEDVSHFDKARTSFTQGIETVSKAIGSFYGDLGDVLNKTYPKIQDAIEELPASLQDAAKDLLEAKMDVRQVKEQFGLGQEE